MASCSINDIGCSCPCSIISFCLNLPIQYVLYTDTFFIFSFFLYIFWKNRHARCRREWRSVQTSSLARARSRHPSLARTHNRAHSRTLTHNRTHTRTHTRAHTQRATLWRVHTKEMLTAHGLYTRSVWCAHGSFMSAWKSAAACSVDSTSATSLASFSVLSLRTFSGTLVA